MTCKISVIIPIYNSEKYLKRTVQSIINQSIGFENIELILVNDNSSDSSKNIIDDYASKYKNIIPIHLKENHGSPSFGRNIGIKNASSNYIMFIDHDDEYVQDMCETLYDEITSDEDIDVVSCNGYVADANGNITISKPLTSFPGENKVIIDNENILKYDNLVIWNKIFKKKIINAHNITFSETRGEDYYFACMYFIFSKKLLHLENYHGYIWHNNEGSLSKGFTYDETLNGIKMCIELCINIKNNNKNPNDFFKKRIRQDTLASLSFQMVGSNKQETKILFDEYCKLEKLLPPEDNVNFIIKIGKKLILSQHYTIAKIYLTLLYYLHSSTILQKIFYSL